MHVSPIIPRKYNYCDVQDFDYSTQNFDADHRWCHGLTIMPFPSANPSTRINRITSMQILVNVSAVDNLVAFTHLNVYIVKSPYLGEALHEGFEASIAELRAHPEYVLSVQPVHLSCQRHTSVTISFGELLLNRGEVLRILFSCYNRVPLRYVNVGTEEDPRPMPVIDTFHLPVSYHIFANAETN